MTVRHNAEIKALESACDLFRTQFVTYAGEIAELKATLASVAKELDDLKAKQPEPVKAE